MLDQLKSLSPHPIECLQIIGGGAKNDYLNQLTADATGLKVVAGPSECTALGNALMQAKALGELSSLDEMRQVVLASVETKIFNPKNNI